MALPRLLKTPFRSQPPDTAKVFCTWLDSGAGQALLTAERALLADILPRVTGYVALQSSVGVARPMLGSARLSTQVVMSAAGGDGATIQAKPCTFPFRARIRQRCSAPGSTVAPGRHC